MVVYTSWREWYCVASFSTLIGAGRILVQESLVMSLKKKKNALLIFLPKMEFLSMALAVLSSNSESYLLLLPQCCNHHPEEMHFWYYRSRRLSLVGDARLYSSTQEAGAGHLLRWRSVCSTERVPGQPWLHRKPWLGKTKTTIRQF